MILETHFKNTTEATLIMAMQCSNQNRQEFIRCHILDISFSYNYIVGAVA